MEHSTVIEDGALMMVNQLIYKIVICKEDNRPLRQEQSTSEAELNFGS